MLNLSPLLFKLKFHLIPIRDWNLIQSSVPDVAPGLLKFHLIPIRDWNDEPVTAPNPIQKVEISLNPY